jgi:hypothetical protein
LSVGVEATIIPEALTKPFEPPRRTRPKRKAPSEMDVVEDGSERAGVLQARKKG